MSDNRFKVIFNNNEESNTFYIDEDNNIVNNIIETYFDTASIYEFLDVNKLRDVPFNPIITIVKKENIYSIGKVSNYSSVTDYFITLNFNCYYYVRNGRFTKIKNEILEFIKNKKDETNK